MENNMSTRKHKNLLFTLSMPNPPSWNGKWSGEGRFYGVIRKFKGVEGYAKFDKILNDKYYSYRWNDGWCASIEVKEVDSKDLPKIRRKLQGFCGYDWMVDDICRHGEIKQR